MKAAVAWVAAQGAIVGLVVACGERPSLAPDAIRFSRQPIEITDHALFDLGVVDVDGDDIFDLFTSNHNAVSGVFLGNGNGEFSDNALSDLGLDQEPRFPGLEEVRAPPILTESGLHVFWQAGRLVLAVHDGSLMGSFKGQLALTSKIELTERGFVATTEETALPTGLTRTTVEFAAEAGPGQRKLVVRPHFTAIPVSFSLDPAVPLERIFVGAKSTHPRSHEFVLSLRDRHGMAWADFNGDDLVDVFIARGGLKGEMARFPEEFADELLCNRGGVFEDCTAKSGLAKKAARARSTAWVDYDNDGRLDLHIVGWSTPDQLFRQREDGSFHDVAEGLGLDLVWSGPSAWFDVDSDGDPDLLIANGSKTVLFVNRDGVFERRPLGAAQAGLGKLSLADYDADGDLDVFQANPKGSVLWVNDGANLRLVEPASVGLPSESLTGSFVDHDNDGLPDLHLVPSGIYRQTEEQRFLETSLLSMAGQEEVEVARCAWFDANNDGTRDLLISRRNKGMGRWKTEYHLNHGSRNHWLQVRLVGPPGNRQAIGGRVSVGAGGRMQVQQVGGAEESQFSQGQYRIYFGLGRQSSADRVTIFWPDGSSEERKNVASNQLLVVRRKEAVETRAWWENWWPGQSP